MWLFWRFCKEGATSTSILLTDKKRLRGPPKPPGASSHIERTCGLLRSKRAIDRHNPYTTDQKQLASMQSSKLGATNCPKLIEHMPHMCDAPKLIVFEVKG
ncbi:hypothetical protein EGR_11312 [Echinococcus granulosus]|uniref:Uncharacterized protein n=1 Tax=Echinococcus granulosus TaxID=6210 RepID=W6U673_ECHGR|nr:hypothetical protein EGR_11312 [Echinococcus granulosus]EUB53837.1 hypothetical protein EGR_11312 [Echinococcus granulosus]